MKDSKDFSPDKEKSQDVAEPRKLSDSRGSAGDKKNPDPKAFLESQDSFDFPTEILYEDSFEDRPLDGAPKQDSRFGGILEKFLSMKRWKKVMLCVATALVVVVAGLAGSFFYLRAQGEKNLKTKVTADADSPEDGEGIFITYNGKKYQYNEDVINFLCLGIDKDTPIEDRVDVEHLAYGSPGLADAIILISINVDSGKIRLLAIPRDSMVPVKVVDANGRTLREERLQINMQHVYGRNAEESCELMVDAVSSLLYKVPIQRYCSLSLAAVPVLNDAIGGVDVQVMEDVQGNSATFHAGEVVHLQGEMARDYIQKRDTGVDGSALGRLERQKQYISNYFSTAKEAVKKDVTLPLTVFNSLQDYMCTNITAEDIAYLVPELLGMPLSAEDMTTVPGEPTWPGELQEYVVDEEQLKAIVVDYFYEEIP